jgi:hypothetical protein
MKKYEFKSVYIGVVGSELEVGDCRDSIQNMRRLPGDSMPVFCRATKGYEARQTHFDKFLSEPQFDSILLLDADQVFPVDTLERLRSHGVPYVSGYYLRRRFNPIVPVWFVKGPRGQWPLMPMTQDPPRGKLIPLGASGWGCTLIHREVVEATQAQMRKEQLVLEDDMDVWPYDLDRIMGAIRGLQALIAVHPSEHTTWPALEEHTRVLAEEIRPLRCRHDQIGSDIRFPFFAREAGYTLMGDPEVRIGHMLNYPLSPDDFTALGPAIASDLKKRALKEMGEERRQINAKRKEYGL